MSRALRRQPLVQKPPAKAPSFKPTGPRPAKKPAGGAAEVAKQEDQLPLVLLVTAWRTARQDRDAVVTHGHGRCQRCTRPTTWCKR